MALQFSVFGGSDLAKLSATEANIPNGQVGQAFLPVQFVRKQKDKCVCLTLPTKEDRQECLSYMVYVR